MTSRGLVLVTGANGYIGARTVEAFLKAGYRVRGMVRSVRSAEPLVSALSDYATNSQLEFVEVPDVTIPDAFDNALKGVTAVAHLASPVSFNITDVDYIMSIARGGTLSILESAAKEEGVKSFVLMSSIGAVRTFSQVGTYTEADWNNESVAIVKEKGVEAGGTAIYFASKVAAERALWDWAEDNKPQFSVTALNPVLVAGPPLVVPKSPEQVSDTNSFVWRIFSGEEFPLPSGIIGYGNYVDVRDVARMAVFAVEHPDVANGQRYIVRGETFSHPQAAADILRDAFPNRRGVIKEGTPRKGYMPGWVTPSGQSRVVGDKAVNDSGRKWIPYD